MLFRSPQLVVIAALGAGLYAGYRWLSRLATQGEAAAAPPPEAEAVPVEKDMGRLELDPATGVYRPAPRRGD